MFCLCVSKCNVLTSELCWRLIVADACGDYVFASISFVPCVSPPGVVDACYFISDSCCCMVAAYDAMRMEVSGIAPVHIDAWQLKNQMRFQFTRCFCRIIITCYW